MGYRSDVSLAFYTLDEGKLPQAAVKLWFEENYCKGAEYSPDELLFGKDYVLVSYHHWKWYDAYPEVQLVQESIKQFTETFDTDSAESTAAYEFVRIGEETEDITEERSNYSEYRLRAFRTINFD
jgi:hypothetical protein